MARVLKLDQVDDDLLEIGRFIAERSGDVTTVQRLIRNKYSALHFTVRQNVTVSSMKKLSESISSGGRRLYEIMISHGEIAIANISKAA